MSCFDLDLCMLFGQGACTFPPICVCVPECIPTLSFRVLPGMCGILNSWEAFISARALSATTAAWVRCSRFGRPATNMYVSPTVSTCGKDIIQLAVNYAPWVDCTPYIVSACHALINIIMCAEWHSPHYKCIPCTHSSSQWLNQRQHRACSGNRQSEFVWGG